MNSRVCHFFIGFLICELFFVSTFMVCYATIFVSVFGGNVPPLRFTYSLVGMLLCSQQDLIVSHQAKQKKKTDLALIILANNLQHILDMPRSYMLNK